MILQQSGNLTNASASFSSSFNSTTGIVIIAAVIIALALAAVGSARVYRWMLEATGYFAQSVEYALKGIITAVFIGIFAVPLYLLSQLDGEARLWLVYAAAVAAAGYVGLVILGFIGDRVWAVVKRRHVEATGHEPFENWGSEEAD